MTIYSLAPSSAGAERNWSIQDFIVSKRRNRLTEGRGTKLVAIYWNSRALERAEQEVAEHPGCKRKQEGIDDSLTWRERVVERADFPHPDPETWEPFSNYGTSSKGNFEGMHGDERDPDADVDGDDDGDSDEEGVSDWQYASQYAHLIKPCPFPVLNGIKVGDLVLWFFGGAYNEWYLGVVTKVQTARAQLPVTAIFEDGTSRLAPEKGMYGATGGKEWVMLSHVPPGMELKGFAKEAYDNIMETRRAAAARAAAAAAPPAGSADRPMTLDDESESESGEGGAAGEDVCSQADNR